jgi:hypothetical protein
MSRKAIRAFYDITQKIKDTLLTDPNVLTVTTGNLSDIDLSKQTIFPLSHIIVNSVTQEEQVLTFNISVLSMDIVDTSKNATTDVFLGNDNEQDILNTQLSVQNRLIQNLRTGNLYRDKYQLDEAVNMEPFRDRFENEMAGWTATFNVIIENDISIC